MKETQPTGNSSPGESSCPSLSLLFLQGGLGTKNLLGTASRSLPGCAAETGAQLAPGYILGSSPLAPPAASKHRGHRHRSLPLLEQPPRGWEGGIPEGVMWVSSCLPAARPTAPFDVLCHLQNTAAGTDPAWPTAPRQGKAVELRHGRCPGEEGLRRRERRWP